MGLGSSTVRWPPVFSLPALVAFALSVFLFAACASVPLPEREGVVLYRKKCGACHRPYAPSEIRERGKEKILAEMKGRAKLSQEEATTIMRYLEPDLAPSHDSSVGVR